MENNNNPDISTNYVEGEGTKTKSYKLVYSAELYEVATAGDPFDHVNEFNDFDTDLEYLKQTPGVTITTKPELNQDQDAFTVTISCTPEFDEKYLDELKEIGVEIEEVQEN